MLRIYSVILDWIASLPTAIDHIAARDRNLADQLQRSSTSVVLNVAEGMGGMGRVKVNSYRIALREMRESIAAIDVATQLGYVRLLDHDALDRQDHILATLVRLAKPKN